MIQATSELKPMQKQIVDSYERGAAEVVAIMEIADRVTQERLDLHELADTRIESSKPIISPLAVVNRYPLSQSSKDTVRISRESISRTIENPAKDSKLIVVVGPCGIHDVVAAREYAAKLEEKSRKYSGLLDIVMRTYFEKPRTITGWEGLIEDPDLDGTYDKDKGYLESRRLISDVTSLGMPTSAELLNTTTPQYLDDGFSWGAVGARTTESQLHRKLASGVSFPVGFKNGTGGNIQIAVDAIGSSRQPHYMDGVNMLNQPTRYKTLGNPYTHLILRGGNNQPNYSQEHIKGAKTLLNNAGIVPAIMIDVSHANSGKDYKKQLGVTRAVAAQIALGEKSIIGAMIESNLVEGGQKIAPLNELVYGQSATDKCIGLDETWEALEILAEAVKARRHT